MKEKLYIDEVLSDEIVNVLDEYCYDYSQCESYGNNWVFEFYFKTSQGGDNVFTIRFAKNSHAKSFLKDLSEQARYFDIDEYVELWLQAKQSRPDICPLNARQLVRDGYEIRRTLQKIASEIRKVA